MPPDAAVAYAAAICSGATLTTPSVKAGSWSAGGWADPSAENSDRPSARVMPSFAAVLTTLHKPTFCSSAAKNTLIDLVVPVTSESVVVPGPSELDTGKTPDWPLA